MASNVVLFRLEYISNENSFKLDFRVILYTFVFNYIKQEFICFHSIFAALLKTFGTNSALIRQGYHMR